MIGLEQEIRVANIRKGVQQGCVLSPKITIN